MRGTVTALMVAVGCLFLSLAASVPGAPPKLDKAPGKIIRSDGPDYGLEDYNESDLDKLIKDIEGAKSPASDTMSEEEFEKLQCDLLRNKLCDMPDDELGDFLKKAHHDVKLATEETEKRKPVVAELKYPIRFEEEKQVVGDFYTDLDKLIKDYFPARSAAKPDPVVDYVKKIFKPVKSANCTCDPCTCPPKAEVVKSTENPTEWVTVEEPYYGEQLVANCDRWGTPRPWLLGYSRRQVQLGTVSKTYAKSSITATTSTVKSVTSSPSTQPKPVTQQPVRRFVQPQMNCPNGRCPLR